MKICNGQQHMNVVGSDIIVVVLRLMRVTYVKRLQAAAVTQRHLKSFSSRFLLPPNLTATPE